MSNDECLNKPETRKSKPESRRAGKEIQNAKIQTRSIDEIDYRAKCFGLPRNALHRSVFGFQISLDIRISSFVISPPGRLE
jgi:hypothetical protein